MSGEEKHKQNLEIYLNNGGSEKLAKSLKFPTLENRAKILYLIKDFQKNLDCFVPRNDEKKETAKTEAKTVQVAKEVQPEKPKFLGLIAQYPVELHKTYQNAYRLWIESCGLKIQLNTIDDEDEESALEIQIKIFETMENFDKQKEILDHYNFHKRIMPTESKEDFSKLSPVELVNKRNSIRSLITRRKQTLEKRIAELPSKNDENYRIKENFINRKKEELQELELQLSELNKKIENG